MDDISNLFQGLGLDPNSKTARSKVFSELRTATIDSNYVVGSGWPKLLFDGESTTGSRQYPCIPSYSPDPGDRVVVLLLSHSGIILGQIPDPSTISAGSVHWTAPTYANSYAAGTTSGFAHAQYMKDSAGNVILQGIVLVPSSGAAINQTIFTLPSGMRPKANLKFIANQNGAAYEIQVLSSGAVETSSTTAPTASATISLSGIMFPAEQ